MAKKRQRRGDPSRDNEYEDEDDFEDLDCDEDEDDGESTIFGSGSKGKSLKALLAPKRLREYGWDRSFERGEAYYRSGAVKSLVQHGARLSATVTGSRNYKGAIWLDGGRLRYHCTCPAGGFCKHLIAAALAWNAGKTEVLGDLDDVVAPGGKLPKSRGKEKKIDLRSHLLSLEKEKLADIILAKAVDDPDLRERLKISAEVANPDGVDLASLRRRIDTALKPPEFDYDNPYWDEEDPYEGYADQLKPILEALESLLAKGQAASVVTLVEYALAELNKQCLSMEYDFVEPEAMIDPLVSLHVRACVITKPKSTALAERLFRLGVRDTADGFGGLPWEKYKPVLDSTGLKHFRQLVEAEWKTIPARTARTGDDSHHLLRRRLQGIMTRFAKADGDIDAQAAVTKKDLSSQGDYAELVKIYRSAKRYDEALAWAEKGWKAFPGRYDKDPELRDLLAGEYRRKRRYADAMALYWNEFAEDPDLERYQELKKQADKNKEWKAWREKAFTAMRERIAAAKKKRKPQGTFGRRGDWNPYLCADVDSGDNSLLVQILLWEKKQEDAWREAQGDSCSERWWLELSAWREKTHPEDCVPIWRRRVERLTQHADQRDYAPAAESLAKLGELMKRIGEGKKFEELVRRLRDELRRRVNFIKELNKRKLP